MGKQLGRAAIIGMVTGIVVLGLGGRFAMRLVALVIHQAPHFGAAASLGIVLIGGIMGTIAGIVYGLTLRLPWEARTTTRGLLFGSALFGVLALTQPSAIRAEIAAARSYLWAIIPLFWAVSIGYALVLARQLAPSPPPPA